jgi:hypothetical protein
MCLNLALSAMKTPKYLVFLLLFVVLAVHTMPVRASTLGAAAELTLKDLGLTSDIILRGPYDGTNIRFALPPAWVLIDGTALTLEITTFIAGGDGTSASGGETLNTANDYLGAVLEVYFNDQLQQSIQLTRGENVTYTVPIAASDLVSPIDAGWHKISFSLDATIDCDLGFHQTTVVINSASKINLSYVEEPPQLSLQRLPWPIYQDRLNVPEPAVAILPSSPSAEELQAGLTVMGTFGRMSLGRLPITMVTEDQLSTDMLANSNLIFVGKPGAFTILQGLNTPLQVANGSFVDSQIGDSDGVLQLVNSPWSQTKAVLMVSGESDQGVIKAAQALSTGNLQTGLQPTYSVVALVNSPLEPGEATGNILRISSPDFTFADFGQNFLTVDEIGENYLDFEFIIPQGMVPIEDPYLELKYSNSALADPDRSGIVVYVNDILVGSEKFSAETTGISTAKIDLPARAFRPGSNILEIVINLIPINECFALSSTSIWATVHPDSLIHLPLGPASDTPFVVGNIDSFPFPFANDPTFSSTAFVLPANDNLSWNLAGDIAYNLGALTSGGIMTPKLFFDSQLPENYQDNHLIVIGKPADLAIVVEMKEALPAYFEAGSNVAVLETQQVIYRISDEKALGYIELFPSLWREDRAILGIFGTTGEGLRSATIALADRQKRIAFTGDFITLDGDKAVVVDTKTGLGTGRVEATLGEDNVSQEEKFPAVQDFEAEQEAMRQTILYIALGILLLMAAVVALALRFRSKKQ